MQELLDRLKQLSEDRNADNIGIKNYMEKQSDIIDELLEKEKEQIMNAYEDGYEACDMDEAMEVNKKLTSGDLYYNMNYNQNK